MTSSSDVNLPCDDVDDEQRNAAMLDSDRSYDPLSDHLETISEVDEELSEEQVGGELYALDDVIIVDETHQLTLELRVKMMTSMITDIIQIRQFMVMKMKKQKKMMRMMMTTMMMMTTKMMMTMNLA